MVIVRHLDDLKESVMARLKIPKWKYEKETAPIGRPQFCSKHPGNNNLARLPRSLPVLKRTLRSNFQFLHLHWDSRQSNWSQSWRPQQAGRQGRFRWRCTSRPWICPAGRRWRWEGRGSSSSWSSSWWEGRGCSRILELRRPSLKPPGHLHPWMKIMFVVGVTLDLLVTLYFHFQRHVVENLLRSDQSTCREVPCYGRGRRGCLWILCWWPRLSTLFLPEHGSLGDILGLNNSDINNNLAEGEEDSLQGCCAVTLKKTWKFWEVSIRGWLAWLNQTKELTKFMAKAFFKGNLRASPQLEVVPPAWTQPESHKYEWNKVKH